MQSVEIACALWIKRRGGQDSCVFETRMKVLLMCLMISVYISVSVGVGHEDSCISLKEPKTFHCNGQTKGLDRFIFWTYRTKDNQSETFIAKFYFDINCNCSESGPFKVDNSSSLLQVSSSLTKNFTHGDENMEFVCYIWDAEDDILTYQTFKMPLLCSPTNSSTEASTVKNAKAGTLQRHQEQDDGRTTEQPNTAVTFTTLLILLTVTIAVVAIPCSIVILVLVCLRRKWFSSRRSSKNPYKDVKEFPLYFQPSTVTQLPSHGVTEVNSRDDISWDTEFEDDESGNDSLYHSGSGQGMRGDDAGNTDLCSDEQSHLVQPCPKPCRFPSVVPSSSCSPTPSSGHSSPHSVLRSLLKNIIVAGPERCQTSSSTRIFHSDTVVTLPTQHRDVISDQRKRSRGHRDVTVGVREKNGVLCRTTGSSGRNLRRGKDMTQTTIAVKPGDWLTPSLESLVVAHWQSKQVPEHSVLLDSHNSSPSGNCSPMSTQSFTASHSSTTNRSPKANYSSAAKRSTTANHSPTNSHKIKRCNDQRTAKPKTNRYTEKQKSNLTVDQSSTANHILIHRHDIQPTASLRPGNIDYQQTTADLSPAAPSNEVENLGNYDYIMPTASSASCSDRGSVTSVVSISTD